MVRKITLTELINDMPLILTYVVPGYVGVLTYNFTALKTHTINKYKIVSAVSLGYLLRIVLCLFFSEEQIDSHPYRVMIAMSFMAVVISYVFGRFIISKAFYKITHFFGIKRTIYQNFWYDIKQPDTWYRVYMKDKDYYYEGQITLMEENQHFPFIRLSVFCIIDSKTDEDIHNYNQFTKNYEGGKNEIYSVILNTQDIDSIVMIEDK